ncbi:hypothetical protein [Azospirillum soli]|uniref:hypothetical protein n=1 Tax=Azospirillum soli TaxID=1304799 RepID=UPI001AE53620|nr:hypothetical protein [Azospirillum soli]MBP2316053.1 hypothetical protein [Azospirillum soli]
MRRPSFNELGEEVIRALKAIASVEKPLHSSLRRLAEEHRRDQTVLAAMWTIFDTPVFEGFAAWRQEARSGESGGPESESWVYVMTDGSTPHKVGYSAGPEFRKYGVRSETGRVMRVVFALPCSRRAAEVESLALNILGPFRQGRSEYVHAPLVVCVAAVEFAHAQVFEPPRLGEISDERSAS